MTPGRIFRIAFVLVACLSLLLNAAFIGLGLRLANQGVLAGGMAQTLLEVPRETRVMLRDALRTDRVMLEVLVADLSEKRRRMLAVASAETADPDALAAAMSDVRDATTRLQEAAHRSMHRAVTGTR